MRIKIVILISLLFPFIGKSQNDTINQRDENDFKQGYWIYYGKDRPESDYPEEGKIEEGSYINNRKEGYWIKYHKDGNSIKLKGQYIDNRPNGKYFKYYPSGQIKEDGAFTNNKYQGPLHRFYESGQLKSIENYGERGKVIDTAYFYFETGCMEYADIYSPDGIYLKTITYQRDTCNVIKDTSKINILNRSHCLWGQDAEFKYATSVDINFIDTNENSISTPFNGSEELNNDSIEYKKQAPIVTSARTKGTIFDPDSYNKIYDENDEIWQDGEFINGRLWNGKVYEYDKDGILLKVKIYKKGTYYSDGHL